MTRWRPRAVGISAALLAGMLTACVGGSAGTPSPAPTGDGTCGPVERPPLQVSSHLVGDAEPPGPFSSVPATSGWHATTSPESGLHDTPLRDAEIVSALESGMVVLAVTPDALASDDSTVGTLVAQFPDRLLVTPYETAMETPVALLSWGVLQRCDAVDPSATTTFVLTERVAADGH